MTSKPTTGTRGFSRPCRSHSEETALSARLIDSREAAAILGLSRRTLWTLYNRGEIPVVRIGRAVRFDPADLRAWVETKKGGGRPC